MYALRSLGIALLAAALRVSAGPLAKRAVAYYDPAANGGSMLTQVENSTLGEPLNVRRSQPISVRTPVDMLCYAGHHFGLELSGRAHARRGDQLCTGNRLVGHALRSYEGWGEELTDKSCVQFNGVPRHPSRCPAGCEPR